jgi:2-dehydro-3-deoxyglucarate aldolase/4-hydroxy-2-oxoheptanedioate aldolase
VRKNPVQEKIKRGEVAIGHLVMEFATPGIAQILTNSGFDFVLYDTEHTNFSMETIGWLIRCSRAANLPAFVRIPNGQYDLMSRTLDAGADGLMIPCVQSREEAQRIIKATKYAPLGMRGTAFGVAHDDFLVGNILETMKAANEQNTIIAQIESVAGVENVEEILSVEGIDVAWIGHFDLTQSMGIPGQFDHSDYLRAVERVSRACAKYHKAGGFMASTPASALQMIASGFRCIAYHSDIRLYAQACQEGVAEIRRGLA